MTWRRCLYVETRNSTCSKNWKVLSSPIHTHPFRRKPSSKAEVKNSHSTERTDASPVLSGQTSWTTQSMDKSRGADPKDERLVDGRIRLGLRLEDLRTFNGVNMPICDGMKMVYDCMRYESCLRLHNMMCVDMIWLKYDWCICMILYNSISLYIYDLIDLMMCSDIWWYFYVYI